MSDVDQRVSQSIVTGKRYPIPAVLDDRRTLDAFAQANNKGRIVCVQGLGFVGAVMALVVANAPDHRYAVIGVDLPNEYSYWKIRSLNDGVFPVVSADPKVEEFYRNAQEQNKLIATYDPYAYSLADVIIVDINLDVAKTSDHLQALQSFDVDLSGFRNAMDVVADVCKEEVLIIIETTVPPGACEKVVRPLMDAAFDRRGLRKRYRLGHSYERVMPGPGYVDSIQNFYRVYAGIDEESARATEDFLRSIIHTERFPLTRLQSTTASEIAKVLENSFRAMNIAFIQEWTEFAHRTGVNLFEVVDAIRMRPTHKNIMKPGLGVGGYCLTKDPLLASWSSKNLFQGEPLPESEASVRINDQMPLFSFRQLLRLFENDLSGKRMLLLGVSYLQDIGDTRNSPVEFLVRLLEERGCELTFHDPYVAFWTEMGRTVQTDIEQVLKAGYDAIVFCTAHRQYRESRMLKDWLMRINPTVLHDTNGVLTETQIEEYARRHRMMVTGRGDFAL